MEFSLQREQHLKDMKQHCVCNGAVNMSQSTLVFTISHGFAYGLCIDAGLSQKLA